MNLAFRTILSFALIHPFTLLPIAMTAHYPVFLFTTAATQRVEPTVVAEAPPLVWPSWLASIDGAHLAVKQGIDQSKLNYLETTYYTRQPMTKIHSFYLELFQANDYSGVTGGLETGHTMTGVQQNAFGNLESDNYPNGQPGPYTNIRVNFSRLELNAPIRVTIKVTAHPQLSFGHEVTHRHNLPPLAPLPKRTLSPEQQEKADDFERKSTEHMGKYDKPVAPRRGPAVPGFAWPQWLVHIEGQPLKIQKTSNMFTSSYATNMDSDSIRSYYADLLSYNGYSVDPIPNRPQSRISSPADHMGSVKGVLYPNGSPGRRIEILVQFRPVDMRGDDLPMKVDLRVSAFAE